MLLTGDYHTHTIYSHGKGTVLENVMRAKEVGLQEIAITDHGFEQLALVCATSGSRSCSPTARRRARGQASPSMSVRKPISATKTGGRT